MTVVTKQFVIDALNSIEEFPIDFDDVWQEAGYTRRDNARRRLKDLEENVDFALLTSEEWSQEGRLKDSIKFSVDGYKHFCLMAKNSKGRETRNYFITIEKVQRQKLEQQFNQPYIRTDFNLLKQEQDKNDALCFEIKKLQVQVESLNTKVGKLTGLLNTAKRKLEIAERNHRSGQWAADITGESTGFTYDADYLFLITGIACRKYFIAKLFENFKLSEDFIKERYSKSKHGDFALGKDKYFTDAQTALATVINHRSKAGISKRELPAMYHFLFDHITDGNNTNRRHLRAR